MHFEKISHYKTRANIFLDLLKRDFIRQSIELQAEYFVTDEPVSFSELNKYQFKSVNTGDIWGKNFQCGWFHLRG